MSQHLTEKLQQYVATRIQQGLHRSRHLQSFDSPRINFSSNDYLSLSSESSIRQAYQLGFKQSPVGSGGSMVVCGYHPTHRALEKAFAEALQVEDALLFSSGYAANLAITQLLAEMDTALLIDKGVHASIYDGLKLAQANYRRYLHQDFSDLSKKIDACSHRAIILTESIFSMSGQQTRLDSFSKWTTAEKICLIVDEAHGFGILGPEGLGGVMEANLTQKEVPLRMIPFGKAMGAHGAIVAGAGVWVDALLQMRSGVYSTAMSPAYAHGLLESLQFLRHANDRREKLTNLIRYFRERVHKSPLKWRNSPSPIQQLQLGCPYRAAFVANKLLDYGIYCSPMRQPTVNKEETGLRVILNYHHEPEQIDLLFNYLEAVDISFLDSKNVQK